MTKIGLKLIFTPHKRVKLARNRLERERNMLRRKRRTSVGTVSNMPKSARARSIL